MCILQIFEQYGIRNVFTFMENIYISGSTVLDLYHNDNNCNGDLDIYIDLSHKNCKKDSVISLVTHLYNDFSNEIIYQKNIKNEIEYIFNKKIYFDEYYLFDNEIDDNSNLIDNDNLSSSSNFNNLIIEVMTFYKDDKKIDVIFINQCIEEFIDNNFDSSCVKNYIDNSYSIKCLYENDVINKIANVNKEMVEYCLYNPNRFIKFVDRFIKYICRGYTYFINNEIISFKKMKMILQFIFIILYNDIDISYNELQNNSLSIFQHNIKIDYIEWKLKDIQNKIMFNIFEFRKIDDEIFEIKNNPISVNKFINKFGIDEFMKNY